MITEYLEKMHQELYEEKLSLERAYQKNELLLKENVQFIYTLENGLDKNYESFSPRDINHESYEKIDILKEEQSHIREQSEKLKDEISDVNAHLLELENVSKNYKEKEQVLIDREDTIENIIETIMNIEHRLEFCTTLLDMDVPRCKLELQSISQIIKKYQQDMQGILDTLKTTHENN